jgi:pilus assembly protein CpaB
MIRRTFTRLDAGVGLLVVAVAFGLLTAALTFGFVSSRNNGDGDTASVAGSVLVVVARTDIRAGETISSASVELVEIPISTVAAGALTSTDDVIDQVARYPLAAGEQILNSKLVDPVNGDALAFAVPEGMRAVSVAFSPVMGAGGLVVPGDRVDVLVYTEYGNLFGPEELVTPDTAAGHPTVITLLQNVLVLAMDRSYTSPVETAEDGSGRLESTESTAEAQTVTLATDPEEAQLLFLAAQNGTLGLAVRRFGDDSEQTIEPEFRLRAVDDDDFGSGPPPAAER